MKGYTSPMAWVKFEKWFEKAGVHDFYIRRLNIEALTFFSNYAVLTISNHGFAEYADVTTESAKAFFDSENQAGDQ